ncbi:hypothetical protein F5Y09DRAFT_34616 [Xylaria sp. FL1042]|nr:hypothetical protein F5Y09DRAFT_34616 [Xylaria sp. FL1042]
MELEAHQLPREPFGTYACHVRRTQDIELGGRPRPPQPGISISSSSSSSRYPSPREGPRSIEGSFRGLPDMNQPVAASLDMRSGSKPWPPSPKPHDLPLKGEAQSQASVACKRVEEGLTEAMLPKHLSSSEEQPEPVTLQRQAKRIRTSDDVDGPGTASLSCKKRRLLLHLVTSRLSRPFSLPATHILIRESGDNMPVLHRIQQLAALGARRAAGHQGALLVRKAAILNRVRIGVRQAAVSRGHTIMADLAKRGNALDHGLLLVTTPAPATFPVTADVPMAPLGQGFVPPIWRPHTTSFHPPIDPGPHQYYVQHNQHQQQQQQQQYSACPNIDTMNRSCAANANQGGEIYDNNSAANYTHNKPRRETTPEQPRRCSPSRQQQQQQQQQQQYVPPSGPVPPTPSPADTTASDEEDNTAFPAASFHDRYADLSDDDMDDVYADFGVLFGSGARSPDRAAASPVEEQFYEEYLDELDGIPWVV